MWNVRSRSSQMLGDSLRAWEWIRNVDYWITTGLDKNAILRRREDFHLSWNAKFRDMQKFSHQTLYLIRQICMKALWQILDIGVNNRANHVVVFRQTMFPWACLLHNSLATGLVCAEPVVYTSHPQNEAPLTAMLEVTNHWWCHVWVAYISFESTLDSDHDIF